MKIISILENLSVKTNNPTLAFYVTNKRIAFFQYEHPVVCFLKHKFPTFNENSASIIDLSITSLVLKLNIVLDDPYKYFSVLTNYSHDSSNFIYINFVEQRNTLSNPKIEFFNIVPEDLDINEIDIIEIKDFFYNLINDKILVPFFCIENSISIHQVADIFSNDKNKLSLLNKTEQYVINNIKSSRTIRRIFSLRETGESNIDVVTYNQIQHLFNYSYDLDGFYGALSICDLFRVFNNPIVEINITEVKISAIPKKMLTKTYIGLINNGCVNISKLFHIFIGNLNIAGTEYKLWLVNPGCTDSYQLNTFNNTFVDEVINYFNFIKNFPSSESIEIINNLKITTNNIENRSYRRVNGNFNANNFKDLLKYFFNVQNVDNISRNTAFFFLESYGSKDKMKFSDLTQLFVKINMYFCFSLIDVFFFDICVSISIAPNNNERKVILSINECSIINYPSNKKFSNFCNKNINNVNASNVVFTGREVTNPNIMNNCKFKYATSNFKFKTNGISKINFYNTLASSLINRNYRKELVKRFSIHKLYNYFYNSNKLDCCEYFNLIYNKAENSQYAIHHLRFELSVDGSTFGNLNDIFNVLLNDCIYNILDQKKIMDTFKNSLCYLKNEINSPVFTFKNFYPLAVIETFFVEFYIAGKNHLGYINTIFNQPCLGSVSRSEFFCLNNSFYDKIKLVSNSYPFNDNLYNFSKQLIDNFKDFDFLTKRFIKSLIDFVSYRKEIKILDIYANYFDFFCQKLELEKTHLIQNNLNYIKNNSDQNIALPNTIFQYFYEYFNSGFFLKNIEMYTRFTCYLNEEKIEKGALCKIFTNHYNNMNHNFGCKYKQTNSNNFKLEILSQTDITFNRQETINQFKNWVENNKIIQKKFKTIYTEKQLIMAWLGYSIYYSERILFEDQNDRLCYSKILNDIRIGWLGLYTNIQLRSILRKHKDGTENDKRSIRQFIERGSSIDIASYSFIDILENYIPFLNKNTKISYDLMQKIDIMVCVLNKKRYISKNIMEYNVMLASIEMRILEEFPFPNNFIATNEYINQPRLISNEVIDNSSSIITVMNNNLLNNQNDLQLYHSDRINEEIYEINNNNILDEESGDIVEISCSRLSERANNIVDTKNCDIVLLDNPKKTLISVQNSILSIYEDNPSIKVISEKFNNVMNANNFITPYSFMTVEDKKNLKNHEKDGKITDFTSKKNENKIIGLTIPVGCQNVISDDFKITLENNIVEIKENDNLNICSELNEDEHKICKKNDFQNSPNNQSYHFDISSIFDEKEEHLYNFNDDKKCENAEINATTSCIQPTNNTDVNCETFTNENFLDNDSLLVAFKDLKNQIKNMENTIEQMAKTQNLFIQYQLNNNENKTRCDNFIIKENNLQLENKKELHNDKNFYRNFTQENGSSIIQEKLNLSIQERIKNNGKQSNETTDSIVSQKTGKPNLFQTDNSETIPILSDLDSVVKNYMKKNKFTFELKENLNLASSYFIFRIQKICSNKQLERWTYNEMKRKIFSKIENDVNSIKSRKMLLVLPLAIDELIEKEYLKQEKNYFMLI